MRGLERTARRSEGPPYTAGAETWRATAKPTLTDKQNFE